MRRGELAATLAGAAVATLALASCGYFGSTEKHEPEDSYADGLITDVTYPGRDFAASFALPPIGPAGETLHLVTDKRGSWWDGVRAGTWSVVLVSRDGSSETLFPRGEPVLDGVSIVDNAWISETTVVLSSFRPDPAGGFGRPGDTELLFWDRESGAITTMPLAITRGQFAGEELDIAYGSTLVDDTLVWRDDVGEFTEGGEIMIASAEHGVRLGPEPDRGWKDVALDPCVSTDREPVLALVEVVFEPVRESRIQYATINEYGYLELRPGAGIVRNAETDAYTHVIGAGVCGDVTGGYVAAPDELSRLRYVYDDPSATLVELPLELTGTAPWSVHLTEDWYVVSALAGTWGLATSIMHVPTGTTRSPEDSGFCLGSRVNGEFIMFSVWVDADHVNPTRDYLLATPTWERCVTYVGVLTAPE